MKYCKEIWDKKAKNYGQRYDLEEINRQVASSLVKENGYLLELGCGNGIFLKKIENKRLKKIGIDFSFGMIKEAKKRLNNSINLIVAEASKLPFKDEIFNQVFCINLFVNLCGLKEVKLVISEAMRVLKKEGILVIEIRNALNPKMRYDSFLKKLRKIPHPYNCFYKWKIKKLIEKNNGKIEEVFGIYPTQIIGFFKKIYSLVFYNKKMAPCLIIKSIKCR